jgi:hypothetical protein
VAVPFPIMPSVSMFQSAKFFSAVVNNLSAAPLYNFFSCSLTWQLISRRPQALIIAAVESYITGSSGERKSTNGSQSFWAKLAVT